MKFKLLALFILLTNMALAQNPWYTAAEQTLPEHVPMPLDRLSDVAKVLEARRVKEEKEMLAKEARNIQTHRELYSATQHFKKASNGTHDVVTVVQGSRILQAKVTVSENRIQRFIIGRETYSSPQNLKVPSQIHNAYNKAFVAYNGELIPVEVYFTDLYSNSPVSETPTSKNSNPYPNTPASEIPISVIFKKGEERKASQWDLLDKPDFKNGKAIGKSNGKVIVLDGPDSNGFYYVQSGPHKGYIAYYWIK